tara:strand:+ start:429 stop:566 length:138 start_codon:yes stop_codon:yes gene_type:complete
MLRGIKLCNTNVKIVAMCVTVTLLVVTAIAKHAVVINKAPYEKQI